MPAKESFDIDGLMVFRSDLTAVDQDGNIVAGVITPDRYFPSDREPLSSEQTGRYTNTTDYWESHSEIIPLKGDVYIYSDAGTTTQGGVTVDVPKIKVGDGVTTIGNLPFIDSDTQQGTAGTLNTTNELAQTPAASESLSGTVNLHKVAKTGSYDDLLNKPTIPSNTSDLTNDSGFITVNDVPQEVFVCNYNSTNNTMDKTPEQILQAKENGMAVLCKDGSGRIYYCTITNQSQIFFECLFSDNTFGNFIRTIKWSLSSGWSAKTKEFQERLISSGNAQNIKTINNESLLGSGNISISSGDVNVQSDWNQTDNTADDYIKNKPTIPTVPTNVSAFTNDAGYLTQETDPTVPSWAKAANKPTYDYSEINNTPTIPSAPGTLTTNVTASQTASAGEAMSGNITLHKVSKTGSYDDLNDKPTITDENVKQELTESSNSYEYPLLASKTITVDGTKTNTTRYAAGLLARGDSAIILKGANDNTLDTPSLFFRRGSDSNTGTDWAIRSTGVETGQNTPLEFLRRYGSGSSSWVSKLVLYTNLLKTEVSGGFESPKFVKSNPSNANGVLLADGTDIPQSTFQQALPAYTNNAGKILAVNSNADGVVWVSVIRIYDGSSAPSSSLGSDGDIYIQTQS